MTSCVVIPQGCFLKEQQITGMLPHMRSALVLVVWFFAMVCGSVKGGVIMAKHSVAVQKEGVKLTVAADGSGDFTSVQQAVDHVPDNNRQPVVIYIKPGTYKEQIKVPASKPFVTFLGSKAEQTILTFNLSNPQVGSTSATYSTYIGASDFSAENITFENSFGTGSQAVAMLVDADRATFRNCRFLGWQDTLYAKGGRQYYKDCYIEGHIDFIFGAATAVFENCQIHSKGAGYIAAPMRFSDAEPTGFVFRHCRLTGVNTGKGVFLGRPWRPFGRVVFIETEMDAHILPAGWDNWRDPERERTAWFAEYKSSGKGANPEARVKWSHQLTTAEAVRFLPENFLKGSDGWNPKKMDFAWQLKYPPAFGPIRWAACLNQRVEWYATDEATRVADNVLLYQHNNGGWEKNLDMAGVLTEREKALMDKQKTNEDTTIDNGATYTQLAYLAKVFSAKNLERHRVSFLSGLDFLLASQYRNGGFPQFFPLRKGYYSHITFNDNAMIGVLNILRDIAAKKSDYAFVDEERRQRAEKAVQKGIECILKTPLSERMAATAMNSLWRDATKNESGRPAKWTYDHGLVLKGIEGVWVNTGDAKYFNYIQQSMDYFVNDDGTIRTYSLTDYNLDNVLPGRDLLLLCKTTGKEKYRKAATLLREQLKGQPRTSDGGFWHKKIYPYQMWLDGIYMAEPFYAEYAATFHETDAFDDIARQFVLMERHVRDVKTGLLYHGWDESKKQRWADPISGHSPNFWGRAMGWYAMALVDTLDYFPKDHPQRAELVAILNRLALPIVKYQEPRSGLWYQVLDRGADKGNYLEASAACMFVYALAKGVRNGYLPAGDLSVAQKGYKGIIDQFIRTDANGQVNLEGTVSVAGLGGNPYRDGSYEYYLSEKVVTNDPKGVGAFLLASNEMEIVRKQPTSVGKRLCVVFADSASLR